MHSACEVRTCRPGANFGHFAYLLHLELNHLNLNRLWGPWCYRSALEEYSWSAYVYLRCGRLFDAVERDKESKRDTQQARYCLRRAMSMAPDWMRACLEYGLHCMDHGNSLEGYMYVNKASPFFPNLELDDFV